MTGSVTPFEIYGEQPATLAEFYRSLLGGEIEQMPGVDYWRIRTGTTEAKGLHGGLSYRTIDGLNGWMLGSALHVMLFLENLIRVLLLFNGLRSRYCQRA